MKKIYVIFVLLFIGFQSFSQISENFQSWTARGGYSTFTQAGSGGTWSGTNIIVAPSAAANGTGSMGYAQFRAGDGILTSPNVATGGVGTITIQARVTGANGGFSIQKNVNGAGWVTVQAFTTSSTTGVQFQTTVNDASANILFRINNTGGTGNRALYVHDIVTTTYASSSPNLAITGTPTNHGSVCVGTPAATVQYTITNTGTAASGVTVVSNDPQFVVSNLSSTTIAATSGTATYDVTFTPSGAGARSATITVASTTSGSNSPTSSMTGNGVASVTQTVTASAATPIGATTATLNGNLTTVGVCPATTSKGFVWSRTADDANPLVGSPNVFTAAGSGGIATGAYTAGLSSLTSNTAYSYKAYVYNGTTYTYSAVQNFTTLAVTPTLTAAVGATVDNPFIITFGDDAGWRAAITGITVNGTPLTAGFTITAGQITFTPSASVPATLLQTAYSPTVVVIATGYTNASVIQPIGAGVAAKLAMGIQPTSPSTNGAALATQPTVTVRDQYNNLTNSTAVVTAAVGAGTWTLGGTTAVAAVSGTTSFTGLTATSAAAVTGATIAFSSPGLTGITSAAFNIPSPPPANDNCANAQSLTLGAITPGTLVGATPQSGFTENDVWYSFTPTCTGSHTVTVGSFTGADIDFKVYSSSCPAGSGTTALYSQTAGSTGTTEINTGDYVFGTTYYIRVFMFGGTPTTFNISVVGNAPAQPSTITAPSTLCAGTPAVYSVTASANASTYNWTLPSGWTGTSTGNTITVTPNTTGGTISVTATNCYGTGTVRTLTTSTPGVAPSTPGAITGSLSTCSAASQTYSVPNVAGVTYGWSLPLGWTGTSTTNSITVTAGSTGGTVSVTATNACGTSSAQSISVTVNVVPSAPVATAGTFVGSNSFEANWNPVSGATGYFVDVYTLQNGAIASWDFPNDPDNNVADDGTSANTLKTITNTATGTVSYTPITTPLGTTSTASGNGWDGGNGTKYWEIEISTLGNSALKLSSIQRSSNTGPKNFKLQFKNGASGTYSDVPGATITVANDWTTGQLNNISLPASCNNQPSVFLRWIMTSNLQVVSGNVAAGGTSAIDNIYITGQIRNFVTGYQNVYTTETFLDVTGLNPSTTYYYVVRADNGGCTSVNSNEISVTTLAPCVPSATIASFSPTSGPVGTRVTITGTNFTGATAVTFGNLPATSFSVENATTIIAQVPSNTPFDYINVRGADNCFVKSTVKYTLLTDNGSCGAGVGAGSASELYISEVFDAIAGSTSYVEIFNGTAGAINLASGNYAVKIVTGTSTTVSIPLTGTVASGATYTLRTGDNDPNNGTACGNVFNQSTASGPFNGNDRVYLTKNGTNIDYVPNPNYGGGSQAGFDQARKPTAIAPNLTYTASDWTISLTEDCTQLGLPPYSAAAQSVTINTHPADITCANVITLSVAASTTTGNSNYTWRYNDPSTMAGWLPISSLPAAYPVAGATTNSITISGNTADLSGYQFYVEVGSAGTGQCVKNSNAAQYKPNSKLVYRSIVNGPWNDASTWEMSDATTGTFIPACTYPVAANCDQVVIRTYVTLPVDVTIDKVTINPGATLEIGSTAKLTFLDSHSGADFVVNGILYDRASAGNGIAYATGATWRAGTLTSIIKTNTSSVANYRDFYDGGISTIPTAAKWYYRYNGDGAPNVVSTDMYYPNLYFESTSGAYSWNTFATVLKGITKTIVLGDLNIGTTGTSPVSVSNNNIAPDPMLVNGNMTIGTGSEFNNISHATPTTAFGYGTGIEIKKNLTVNGKLIVNANLTGLLLLSGSGDQTIDGTGDSVNVQALTINNNTRHVIVNRAVNVFGKLLLETNSGLNLGTGDISLKSTRFGTANVAASKTGTNINYNGAGRFIVERFINSDNHIRAWQFLSTPTQSNLSINATWQEGNSAGIGAGFDNKPGYGTLIYGQGGTGAGFDATTTGVNIKSYQPASDTWNNGPTSTTQPVFNPNGWMLYVRGNRLSSSANTVSSSTVLRTRGQLYEPGNAPLTVPPDITVPQNKYQSAGNPFASAIDLRLLTQTNLTDYVYVWDPSLGTAFGRYRTLFRLGVGTDYQVVPNDGTGLYASAINNTIESGQAFFVKATPLGTGSLGFPETAKIDANRVVTRTGSGGNSNEYLRVNLYTRDVDGNPVLLDGTMAAFGDYSKELDYHDALKFNSTGENVGLRIKNAVASVEARPSPEPLDTLHLDLTSTRQIAYQWETTPSEISKAGRAAWIYDRYLNTNTPVNLTDKTYLDFTVSADPLSAAADRFKIVFTKIAAPTPVKFISVAATRNADRSINVKWKVENEMNITGYTIERSADGRTFSGILSSSVINQANYAKDDLSPLARDNYYRIKATGLGGDITYSDIVKVAPLPTKEYISVYPNPVESKTAQLIFANQPAGLYQVQVINNLGQVIYNSSVKVSGYNFVHPIVLGGRVAQGNYEVKVVNAEGKVSSQKIVVN